MDVSGDDRILLRRLLGIGRDLLGASKPEAVFERVLDAAIELTGAERGFLCLSEKGRLRIPAARNLDRDAIANAQQKLSGSIVQRVLSSGLPLTSVDASEDDRLAFEPSIRAKGIRSVACLPLTLSGAPGTESEDEHEVIGCVYLDHRWRTRQFLEPDLELLELFGTHAALAVQNARFVALLRERNAQLEDSLDASVAALQETRSLLESATVEAAARYDFPGLIYASTAMHHVLGLIDRTAESDLAIFLNGESGTGKERLARAIHWRSGRGGAFVPVNCGAVPAELFESEFFGHKKGAFSGADRDREGLFEAADGGTLFLDEVTELATPLQVKLLRALQESEVRRVGEAQARRVDVRIVAASNRDVALEVQSGRFREDLYYRLQVLQIDVPPLRERLDDVPLLVGEFVGRLCDDPLQPPSVAPDALALLAAYDWPGNVRELENEMRRAVALSKGSAINAELLSERLGAAAPAGAAAAKRQTLAESVGRFERQLLTRALDRFDGNKTRAAAWLGISRNGLAHKMKRLGMGS